ncbi:MAG: (E)-4-hydroxy-3-methylbut-2-enyl-diphosphate synthase, partial [Gaiellales bacterium]|nr:(E)-4-hydroxy-3-methylbut-2-enyl-diphosphate synthase [Gaiellales bacterium]
MASERQIVVGGIPIGGGAPVSVQSMTTTKTHDVAATLEQIGRLREAGADIVRVAVPGIPDADALPAIIAGAGLPIIADIHFNASLALRALEKGVAAVRINPGNIGGEDKVAAVVRKAQATGTPLRIGANSGSLPEHLRPLATADPAGALVDAALEEVALLERLGFDDVKISVKSSSVPVMIEAYRR